MENNILFTNHYVKYNGIDCYVTLGIEISSPLAKGWIIEHKARIRPLLSDDDLGDGAGEEKMITNKDPLIEWDSSLNHFNPKKLGFCLESKKIHNHNVIYLKSFDDPRGEHTHVRMIHNTFNNWCILYRCNLHEYLSEGVTVFSGKIKDNIELEQILKMTNLV
jgi:hypothetical protein